MDDDDVSCSASVIPTSILVLFHCDWPWFAFIHFLSFSLHHLIFFLFKSLEPSRHHQSSSFSFFPHPSFQFKNSHFLCFFWLLLSHHDFLLSGSGFGQGRSLRDGTIPDGSVLRRGIGEAWFPERNPETLPIAEESLGAGERGAADGRSLQSPRPPEIDLRHRSQYPRAPRRGPPHQQESRESLKNERKNQKRTQERKKERKKANNEWMKGNKVTFLPFPRFAFFSIGGNEYIVGSTQNQRCPWSKMNFPRREWIQFDQR